MGRHKSDGRGPASPLGGPQIGERGMATPRTQTTQGAGMAFTAVSPQAEVGDTIFALRGLPVSSLESSKINGACIATARTEHLF